MTCTFDGAGSGLQRLHAVGHQIRSTSAFKRLEHLLDHHESMASLQLEAVVGADGRLRHLEIRGLSERRKNPFFRRPLRRWFDRLRIVYHRYNLSGNEISERMVMGVYHEVAPALARVVQLVCHLEVYAASRSFAERARLRGLDVCLPEIVPGAPYEAEALFNPLLMNSVEQLIPSDLTMDCASPINLVTGPNSGGKTRLLQAIGIAQVWRSRVCTHRAGGPAAVCCEPVCFHRRSRPGGPGGRPSRNRAGADANTIRKRAAAISRPPRRALLRHQPVRGHRDRRNGPPAPPPIAAGCLRHDPLPRFCAESEQLTTDDLRFLHAEVADDGSAAFGSSLASQQHLSPPEPPAVSASHSRSSNELSNSERRHSTEGHQNRSTSWRPAMPTKRPQGEDESRDRDNTVSQVADQ